MMVEAPRGALQNVPASWTRVHWPVQCEHCTRTKALGEGPVQCRAMCSIHAGDRGSDNVWKPEKTRLGHPTYSGLLRSLEQDIATGRLTAGERISPQRKVADYLGVQIGIVTKAFREASRRGLVVSRVGRGSYALQLPENLIATDTQPAATIDLRVNTATIEPFNDVLNRVFGALARRKSLHGLLEYHPVPGIERHRAAGAKWMALRGVNSSADRVIVCNGVQEALMAVLATVTNPGETVLTESLNYSGIKRFADLFRMDIRGVETDGEGLLPEGLLRAAQGTRVAAILCSPTLHNPTNATMSLARRLELIRVAGRLRAFIIEDDSSGHLSGDPTPPVAALAPERTVYLCGTSKSMAPGLRIGFISTHASLVDRLCQGINATSWTSPTLMGEVATLLIEEEIAHKLLSWHRAEATARLAMARNLLGRPDLPPAYPTYHLWLPLPGPWRTTEFCEQARLRGVLINPSEAFAVDRAAAPHAVRVSLGGVSSRERLRAGLEVIADILGGGPGTATDLSAPNGTSVPHRRLPPNNTRPPRS